MKLPYKKAIEHLTEIQDSQIVRSPFEMIECIAKISTLVEECIAEFWADITIIDPDKLVLDGDNILCLYLYIIMRARIPNMFAYMKMMDAFSTSYVRSISRYGYCLCTLEIALERITHNSIEDLLQIQNVQPEAERSQSYANNLRESMKLARQRTGSLRVEEFESLLNPAIKVNGSIVNRSGRASIASQHSQRKASRQAGKQVPQMYKRQVTSSLHPPEAFEAARRISIREFNEGIDSQIVNHRRRAGQSVHANSLHTSVYGTDEAPKPQDLARQRSLSARTKEVFEQTRQPTKSSHHKGLLRLATSSNPLSRKSQEQTDSIASNNHSVLDHREEDNVRQQPRNLSFNNATHGVHPR